tara:strand:+ start:66 stop:1334 length:1269 start_codon:yes stop_codon:yes gene_type:complete
MKLQKILARLQKLHPKEIDLSLNRINQLIKKLGNPQDKLNCIQVCGTNGKFSTIAVLRAILKEANYKCNIYTSPHIKKINERFIFNDEQIEDEQLANLLEEVEEINNGQQITFFEILTAAFFYGCKKYNQNITICEFGLFARFDAVNILKKNLANIVTSCGLDHLDWLPKNEQNIKKIIFEKTSDLLNKNIIVAKQSNLKITEYIKENLIKNSAKKFFFNENYSYSLNENGFFYYQDQYGELKLPMPNVLGEFQLENAATAIATLRVLEKLNIKENHIKAGIVKIQSIARLQEIKEGRLKDLCKNNKIFCDGSHNPDGAKVLNNFLETLECKKHVIIGMMSNKDHIKYVSHFKNISSLTTIDIPNQPNSIRGEELKNKLCDYPNISYKASIYDAIKSIKLSNNDVILITGSLYLAGEVLKLN